MSFLSTGETPAEFSSKRRIPECLSPLFSKGRLYFERALNVVARNGHSTFR